VKQLPETLNSKQGRLFFGALGSCMNIERPGIVFDCSKVLQMDSYAVHLLLCCLEEAMKRNGDVKLAAISAGARTTLEHTGVVHLFEIFDTTADAVNSFGRLPSLAATPECMPGGSPRGTEGSGVSALGWSF
jgi:anti-anti-sigma factor